eukprot:scaffold1482_cov120-Cylindrotheca_fusiformis.AAC.8
MLSITLTAQKREPRQEEVNDFCFAVTYADGVLSFSFIQLQLLEKPAKTRTYRGGSWQQGKHPIAPRKERTRSIGYILILATKGQPTDRFQTKS